MRKPIARARHIFAETSGNVAIMAALCSPLILYSLGLGIDYGMITLQQRRLQQLSDIGAIVAAADINHAADNLVANFQQNGLNVAVETENGYSTTKGSLPVGANIATFDAVASFTPGIYVADPTVAMKNRFVAGRQPYDAIKVSLTQKADMMFANAFTTPPDLAATGTASASKLVAFSVGSRLASINGGVLNALLGSLLGTTISLKVVDYEALASTDVELLSYLDMLATDLNLTAATYNDLLATDISYPQMLKTLGKSGGLTPTITKAIDSLTKSLGTTQLKVKLKDLLNLGSTGERAIGSGSHLSVETSVMDLISAAALAANQKKQVSANLNAVIPGLATVKLSLAIGEMPVGVAANAVGTTGSAVRTPQIRLMIETSVSGLQAIAGLNVRVPLYVEIAPAEARLSSVTCLGGTVKNANVGIDAVPGIAEIALGDVNTNAFVNFGSEPRVTPATLIDLAILKVKAMAQVDIGNTSKTKVVFQPADIAAKTIKNVSTRDTLTSTVQSLLMNTSIEVNILGLGLGLGGDQNALQTAVANTLGGLTQPLDNVLYNTLLMLGIKVGEADIRVTDVRCQQSVLVQ
jgi:uncharacterized membrane protein